MTHKGQREDAPQPGWPFSQIKPIPNASPVPAAHPAPASDTTELAKLLTDVMRNIARHAAPNNRTFDQLIKDVGFICDMARAAVQTAEKYVPHPAPAAQGHTAAEVRQAYEDGRASMTHLLPEKPTRGVLMTVRSAVDLATGGQIQLHDSVIELIYHNIRQATRLTAFHAAPQPEQKEGEL